MTSPQIPSLGCKYHEKIFGADIVISGSGQPFIVSGTGKPLRQFIYSRDLAKLMIWTLFKYDDIDPLILSPAENEEISIKQVADAIVKSVGFEGDYKVSIDHDS